MRANEIKTFDKNGRCLYEEGFNTAEQAWEAYNETVRSLKETANLDVSKFEVTVARFRDGKMMHFETIKK